MKQNKKEKSLIEIWILTFILIIISIPIILSLDMINIPIGFLDNKDDKFMTICKEYGGTSEIDNTLNKYACSVGDKEKEPYLFILDCFKDGIKMTIRIYHNDSLLNIKLSSKEEKYCTIIKGTNKG